MALPQYEPKPAADPITEEKQRLDEVTNKIPERIGIHSGKGGVGKTFIATQLALIQSKKQRVGLIDADVDCPNIPQTLGLEAELKITESGLLQPINYEGIKIVSTQFMRTGDEPIIIRGPIKHRLLTDLIEKTDWGEIDLLIFDFPPGTSDIPLSAMQVANLTGIIIVTTPSKSSIGDATKAINMAKKLGTPILGIIENMAGPIFGEGEGKKLSEETNIPLICTIPLSKETRELSEKGTIALTGTTLNTLQKIL